ASQSRVSAWALVAWFVVALLSRLLSPRPCPARASASDAGGRQHWQGPGFSDAPSAHPSDGVEPVPRGSPQVSRQIQGCDPFILYLPRSPPDNPADVGVLCHPC